MYRRIGELKVDPKKVFGCDNVSVDINESIHDCVRLRVSFCGCSNHKEDVFIDVYEDYNGNLHTGAEYWENRCLVLAAKLDKANERLM